MENAVTDSDSDSGQNYRLRPTPTPTPTPTPQPWLAGPCLSVIQSVCVFKHFRQ